MPIFATRTLKLHSLVFAAEVVGRAGNISLMDGEEIKSIGIPQRINGIGQRRVQRRNDGSYEVDGRYSPATLWSHDWGARRIERSGINNSFLSNLQD